MATIICKKCGNRGEPGKDFRFASSYGVKYLRKECRKCEKAAVDKWRAENPAKLKKNRAKSIAKAKDRQALENSNQGK